jgi:hypothetical protein
MSVRPLPEAAVVASTPLPWIAGGPRDALVSLALGLIGVCLARMIFVNRENRALGYHQRVGDTLPITLIACLIAFGIIWDGHLLYSKAIGTGVGVGWATMAIVNQLARVITPGAADPTTAAKPKTVPRRVKVMRAPTPGSGIGGALKASFPASSSDEPDDFARRLDEIDRGDDDEVAGRG